MISLGCPKNLVDSEMILGNMGLAGFRITARPEDADVIVVNTCGFIDKAKEESVNTILEACELKRASPTPKKVIVTGCLGQRYGDDLRREIPEVDAIVGLGQYDSIGETLRSLVGADAVGADGGPLFQVSDPDFACHAETGRLRLTPSHFGYVRISEGCDNPCTFCAIPKIRGRFRSKPLGMIEDEVRELVDTGCKEVVLISQDTTSYGVDIDGVYALPRLLERVAGMPGVRWVRLLYVYPACFSDEMIEAIASIPEVVKYVDIPLQHISEKMLRRMGRRLGERGTRALLERMRDRIPGLYLRTTFIVGFPGEDECEFGILRDYVREFRFERLGVFTYSREENTPAFRLREDVPEEVVQERLEELMLAQQEVAFEQNRSRVGERVEVLLDRREGGRWVARSAGEAPEIDPTIIVDPAVGGGEGDPVERVEVDRRDRWKPGDFVEVRITGHQDYDLLASPSIAERAAVGR